MWKNIYSGMVHAKEDEYMKLEDDDENKNLE